MGYCAGTIKGDMENCPNAKKFGECSFGSYELYNIKNGDACDHAIFRALQYYNILYQGFYKKLSPEMNDPNEYRKSFKRACENADGCKWIPGAVKADVTNKIPENGVISIVNKNPSSVNCEMYSQTCGFKGEIERCEKKYEDSQSSLRSKSNKLDISYGINFGLSLAIVILIVVLILNKKK